MLALSSMFTSFLVTSAVFTLLSPTAPSQTMLSIGSLQTSGSTIQLSTCLMALSTLWKCRFSAKTFTTDTYSATVTDRLWVLSSTLCQMHLPIPSLPGKLMSRLENPLMSTQAFWSTRSPVQRRASPAIQALTACPDARKASAGTFSTRCRQSTRTSTISWRLMAYHGTRAKQIDLLALSTQRSITMDFSLPSTPTERPLPYHQIDLFL